MKSAEFLFLYLYIYNINGSLITQGAVDVCCLWTIYRPRSRNTSSAFLSAAAQVAL